MRAALRVVSAGLAAAVWGPGSKVHSEARAKTIAKPERKLPHPYDALKLAASVPTTNTHPSTSTNNRILNGAEINIGDSIIMPIDINTLATTRSMITNGMKIKNPISNAVFC